MSVSVILDIILAAVIAINLFIGYKRGFIKTLFGLAGVLLSLVIAFTFAGPVGGYINDNFAKEALESVISDSLLDSFEEDDVSGLIEKIEDYAPSKEIANKLSESFRDGGKDAIGSIASDLAEKLSLPMCNAVAFFGVFVLAHIVLSIAAGLLDNICSLPLLNFANNWLGLAMGAVSAVLIAMVLARSFECMLPWLASTYPRSFSEDMVGNTVLLNFFCHFNLFGALIVGVSGLVK